MGSLKNESLSSSPQVDGATIVARALKSQGVKVVFGVVGIPVIEIAEACTAVGIQFIGTRNEQTASYAAGAYGFLTGTPGVCLVVSGPGLVHALAGLANAKENCWPMVLLGGSSETSQELMGAFQEFPQVESCRPYTKLSTRPPSLAQIPAVVEKVFRTSVAGRPGACYIDLPADIITGKCIGDSIRFPQKYPDPPKCMANPKDIETAIRWIKSSQRPLVIVGKGAAYAKAEDEVKALVESANLPFLPTPMGKGVMNDKHPLCVSAARSLALKSADVILLLGARLNWILHFGLPPRFKKDVKIIQIDIFPEEFGNNVPTPQHCSLFGHIPLVVNQLISSLNNHRIDGTNAWHRVLQEKINANRAVNNRLCASTEIPTTYYRALNEVKQALPLEECVIIGEGANTMDIGRTVIDQTLPRRRLDAGSFGTMGVGMGFAIAAHVTHPDKRVVCVVGDSAFGFSAMDLETAARYSLPLLVLIINNNGIYSGLDPESFSSVPKESLPSTALLPEAQYEKIAEAFGGRGWFVSDPNQVGPTVREAFNWTGLKKKIGVVNIIVAPWGTRKEQEFSWLTRAEESNKPKL